MERGKRLYVLVGILILLLLAIWQEKRIRRMVTPVLQRWRGQKTVADRVEEYGEAVRTRLSGDFAAAGVPYPPDSVVLVGLKHEKRLEVWAAAPDGGNRFIRSYPVLGASGKLGPKLEQGDMQVPEGIYRVEFLNPNSRFHLALRLDYPNEYDRERAEEDGRSDLGGDIMIHGGIGSIGCLAMGDEAAEDLFVLAVDTGIRNVTVVLSPVDFRTRDLPDGMPPVPEWTQDLYGQLRSGLADLQR